MRYPDWQILLAQFVASAPPFAWGRNDCCLFAADAVRAMTGVDHGAEYRGLYQSEKTALRLIKELGGLRAIATKALGDAIPVSMARIGDVVLLDGSLGICNGATIIGPGKYGAAHLPMREGIAAWRV